MGKNSAVYVQTFEKGLQLLELLVEEKQVTVTSVARHMGIQKSASYRFLSTLRLHGYVDKDAHNNYVLTDKLSKLGTGILPRRDFVQIAAEFLDELAKKNKDNFGICNLGMWNGKEIVYRLQSSNATYAQFSVGCTVPAYCSALGKAILAFLPDNELEGYLQRTEFLPFTDTTTAGPEQLLEDLAAVRERGYAIMDGELYPSLKGIAVPVLCGKLPVRYAVSLTQTIYGPIDGFLAAMVGPLQETVQELVKYVETYGFS
ncbi:MAG: IclR family transcriptional regulator [Desulfovibrio sp.]|nr:IclR family transcriptional regulator [Desulfovibrio sp.]